MKCWAGWKTPSGRSPSLCRPRAQVKEHRIRASPDLCSLHELATSLVYSEAFYVNIEIVIGTHTHYSGKLNVPGLGCVHRLTVDLEVHLSRISLSIDLQKIAGLTLGIPLFDGRVR